MKNRITLIVLSSLLIACNGTGRDQPAGEDLEGAEVQTEATVKSDIEAINQQITSLMEQGKFEEAGQFFAPDVVQMISGQPPIRGRESWVEAQRQASAIGEWKLDLEVLDLEIMGDRAVERGRGIQTFEANENSPMPSMELTGDYLVLWVKTDAGWQIQWDYVVVETPEPGPDSE